MATCGYICPKCEGSGFLEDGKICDWCTVKPVEPSLKKESITDEEWMKEVHEGKCCGD